MKKKKKTYKSSKEQNIFQLMIVIVIIIIIIIFAVQKNNNQNYNDIKIDKRQFLIYTKYEDKSTQYLKQIPYVNLKADVFKLVNEDIYKFCRPYKNNKESVITYQYDINGKILSLVVQVIDNNSNYAPEPHFRTYNINLDTEEVIADEALLEYFGVNKNIVQNKIKRQLEKYHKELIRKRYYAANECNFNCFLKHRGITRYLDNVHYYIKEGNLIAYKSFTAHSIFGEEEYFEDKDFEFLIATAPIESQNNEPLSSKTYQES